MTKEEAGRSKLVSVILNSRTDDVRAIFAYLINKYIR
jgi:hypothetical protein